MISSASKTNYSSLPVRQIDSAWNPKADSGQGMCRKPGKYYGNIGPTSSIHLKILSGDGSCVYFNSNVPLLGDDYSVKKLIFKIPINTILKTSTGTTIVCDPYSDINSPLGLRDYWQDPAFMLERGQIYMFQITEQPRLPNSTDDVEKIIHQIVLQIPIDYSTFTISGTTKPTVPLTGASTYYYNPLVNGVSPATYGYSVGLNYQKTPNNCSGDVVIQNNPVKGILSLAYPQGSGTGYPTGQIIWTANFTHILSGYTFSVSKNVDVPSTSGGIVIDE